MRLKENRLLVPRQWLPASFVKFIKVPDMLQKRKKMVKIGFVYKKVNV